MMKLYSPGVCRQMSIGPSVLRIVFPIFSIHPESIIVILLFFEDNIIDSEDSMKHLGIYTNSECIYRMQYTFDDHDPVVQSTALHHFLIHRG